ncbi:MAG: terpene cyclase/mutase family protein [Verrucomicrobia bacterium]|nr:terpene cyclase/mutase family protein [Verrucomicrobiota bacterium]
MSELTYLERLHLRLAAGVASLPAERVATASKFFITSQRSDGGFAGREGESDLYYTAFALRGLAIAGALQRELCERAVAFVRQHVGRPANIIDFVSLLYAGRLIEAAGGLNVLGEQKSDWTDAVAAAVEAHRSPDGGYAKKAGGAMGSTYHTFLAALVCGMIQRPLPSPDRIAGFLKSRLRDDGGFAELPVMKRSGTNPTAAAVALAGMLGSDTGLTRGAADALAALQSPVEGGFHANRSAPAADLLSTFTALLTLEELGAMDRVNGEAARRFVESLAMQSGGFRAGVWDDQADVEYTFYGLGSLALLAGATT